MAEAVKKTTVKTEKKVAKASVAKAEKVESTLKIAVLGVDGKEAGTITLPEAIFGAKVNKTLIAQAVRVYLANQRQGNASTKTRGEVAGSTRKIYRQKGTGRARHGGIRAPIFVKGGIAHGPKPKDYSLAMPTKMKRAALFSALSAKLAGQEIAVVTGIEKLDKTKTMAKTLSQVGGKKTLLVMPENMTSVYKAARNIEGVSITPAAQLTTYAVMDAKKLVFMKDAIETLEKTFIKEKAHDSK